VTPGRTSLTFGMFVVMLVLAALDQTILATALPSIANELHGHARLPWVFSAYLIASTVVIPLYGKLADIHGSKPLLLGAIGLFLAGSLACGFSSSMTELIVARGVQGAGGGGLMTLTMLGVVDLYPVEARGRYQGLLGATYGLSTLFGPLAGGYLVEHLSWHWTFLINVPPALIALGVLAACFRRPPVRHPQPVDYAGAVLLAALLVSLLLVTRTGPEAVAVAPAWTLWTAAAVFAAAFFAVESRVSHPLLSLALFRHRGFAAATALSAATGITLFTAVVFLPLYLQNGLGYSPTVSAWQLLPVSLGITVAAIVGGRRLRADGRVRATAVGACALSAVSFVMLAAVFHFAPERVGWMSLCLLPLGVGIGTLFPLVTVVAQFSVPPRMIGVGTSTPIMLRSLGGALGVAALGALLADGIARFLASGVPASLSKADPFPDAFAAGIQPVYGVGALVCVVMAGVALFLPERLVRPGVAPDGGHVPAVAPVPARG